MKVSDYITEFLHKNGVEVFYELTGGMITHLLDSLYKLKKAQIISMHHEQAAAFAAEGSARESGIPGVAFATSGPGAINLLTGIASCYYDSVPAIFITGQVNLNEIKNKKQIRQLGFQETDIVSMAKPITKKSWFVKDSKKIPDILNEAWEVCLSERPGPVLIDIPMNIQRESISKKPKLLKKDFSKKIKKSNALKLDNMLNQLKKAKKPLILGGGGIRAALSSELFLKLVNIIKIPVVYSLMGVDLLPYDSKYRVGMIGTYGNRYANLALKECDLLIVLGSRLDIRQTGADTLAFKSGKVIYHIDCDVHEINNRIKGCKPIVEHIKTFCSYLLDTLNNKPWNDNISWLDEISLLKNKWPDISEIKDVKGINPNIFIKCLSENSAFAFGYSLDVGQNQMWAAQSLRIFSHQRVITSGGLGSMGFALPSAIGLSIISRKKPFVVIVGDGGMQINIQEMQTIKDHNLPIKIIVLNNNSLGMVRQFQESYFDSRFQSTLWGYGAPDFVKVANSYDIAAKKITANDEIEESLIWLWKDRFAPSLLEVKIDTMTNLYPKISFGKPFFEMEPFS